MTDGYTELNVEITRDDDCVRVMIAGDLDHGTAPGLRVELEQAAGDGVHTIDLDLTGVTFIDSAALQVFVSLFADMQARGGSLVISEASPVVARILDVTRLGELFGQ